MQSSLPSSWIKILPVTTVLDVAAIVLGVTGVIPLWVAIGVVVAITFAEVILVVISIRGGDAAAAPSEGDPGDRLGGEN